MSYIYSGDEKFLDQIIKERPVLNPVYYSEENPEIRKIDNEAAELVQELAEDMAVDLLATFDVLLLIRKQNKYPKALSDILLINWKEGVKIERQLFRSLTDNRWQRSLIDWLVIISRAVKSSPSAASRKYYAKTPDGKRTHLHPKYIEKMMPKVTASWNNFQKDYPAYIRVHDILNELIDSDEELHIEYLRRKEVYKREWNERQQKEKQDQEFVKYTTYNHFSIRHPYDPQLYAKQKAKYDLDQKANPKPTGIEEHKLQRSKLPKDVIEELKKRGYNF